MAFNNRKFQRLIEEEKNAPVEIEDQFEDDFADDFTDDFADDFADEIKEPEAPAEEKAEEPAPVTEFEPEPEPVVEEPKPEPEPEPEIVFAPAPMPEPEPEPAIEEYDAHKMWQEMAALAIKAKQCITAGAFFRANDIVNVMRAMLVEMMCRANGFEDNFSENADKLNDECKQDIYTSYVATLNAQALYDVVTHIMAVTYKYI